MFMGPPTLIMSIVFIPAASNAIAFGAAETGSMNENEQTNVAGTHKRIGLIQR